MTGAPFSDPAYVADLARRLLGEPNRRLSTARELRFGSRGSLAVRPDRGVWRDHEAGVGGGVLDLVVHAGQAQDRAEAARLLEGEGVIAARESPTEAHRRAAALSAERTAKEAVASALVARAKPVERSPAATWLRTARAILAPLDGAALGFLADAPLTPYRPDGRTGPAMVAAVVSGGRVTGAHLTFLRADGLGKADVSPARKMVGTVGGGFVPLIPGTQLVVAEGVESALSAWEAAGKAEGPDGASLGCVAALSAGGVAAMRWPDRIRALLIAPDRDASGAGERAAQALASRAHAAGLDVAFIRPPPGCGDWNDVARAERVRP